MAFMQENNRNVFSNPNKGVPKRDPNRERFHATPETFQKFNGTNESLTIAHKRFLKKYVVPFFSSIFHDFEGATLEPNHTTGVPELVLCFDARLGQAPDVQPGDTIKKFTALEAINKKIDSNDTASQIAAYNNMSKEDNNTAYKLTTEAEEILSDYIYHDDNYEPNYYLGTDRLMFELPDQPNGPMNTYGNNKSNIRCVVRGVSADLVCRAIFGGNSKDGIIDYMVTFAGSRSMYDQSTTHIISINRCHRSSVKELIDDIGINTVVAGAYDFVTV